MKLLRALATPTDESPISSQALLEQIELLRGPAASGGDFPVRRRQLLEEADAARERATAKQDFSGKPQSVLDGLNTLPEPVSPRADPAIKSRRLLEELNARRVGRGSVDYSATGSRNGAATASQRALDQTGAARNLAGSTNDSASRSRRSLEPVPAPPAGRASADSAGDASELLEEVDGLAAELAQAAPEDPDSLQELHPSHRLSGCNLLHYLALRRREIRPLQTRLGEHGLASVADAEAHVAASLHAVRSVLRRSLGGMPPAIRGPAPDGAQGLELLAHATGKLVGPQPQGRRVRIMVTVSGEEANESTLIRRLLQSGMNCLRINCAHDEPEEWLALVQQVRAAEKELGQSCKILMDVSGPKPRTGPVEPGPPMLKWRPIKNRLGQLVRPAIVALAPPDAVLPEEVSQDVVLRLPTEFLEELRPREELKLKDARGVPRRLIVRSKHGAVWLAEGHTTSYVTDGTVLRAKHSGNKAQLRGLPSAENPILLEAGDALRLTKSLKPGRSAVRDCSGRLVQPAAIGCTLGEAFCQIRAGQRVLIDDGKVECIVRKVADDAALLDVVRVTPGGGKLRANRGLNFPDSRLRLPALTAKDFRDLSFIAQHADMVGFSFVQRPDDVFQLQEHLSRLGKREIGIVLKVETRRAFENLPALLWAAMRTEAVGVMIARGDLAVECGYEHLAEVQEQILWLCEAAHLPVIWATQVLESLAKEGVPTRAEITDAAMSERAQCVMLNKGPHIEKAVLALDGIFSRMQSHRSKTPIPRQLQSWDRPPWP